MRALAITAAVFASVVVAVLTFWPGPAAGPEPIRWGRDTCARCRMHLSRAGFAGELRARDGTLTKYDDLGCMLRAMMAARAEIPEAWVEDHDHGTFVPLLGATLVRAARGDTPMGYGIVAFASEEDARRFRAASAGTEVTLEELLHEARDEGTAARAAAADGSAPPREHTSDDDGPEARS